MQNQGLSAFVDIDRDTAARLAITPSTVDDALYDAFGQRIISTIFTQSNQYRVILEADPSQLDTPEGLGQPLRAARRAAAPTPLSSFATISQQPRRCRSTTSPSSRPPTSPSTPPRASRSARR